MLMGPDRGVERGGRDAFVLGQQIVGVRMEIRDAADHGRAGHEMVAIPQQPLEALDVLGVAAHEPIAGRLIARVGQLAVFGEVVQADDLVARLKQLLDEVSPNEPGRSRDQNFHAASLSES